MKSHTCHVCATRTRKQGGTHTGTHIHIYTYPQIGANRRHTDRGTQKDQTDANRRTLRHTEAHRDTQETHTDAHRAHKRTQEAHRRHRDAYSRHTDRNEAHTHTHRRQTDAHKRHTRGRQTHRHDLASLAP